MQVKATAVGFYGSLREVGDIFPIRGPEDLGNWMEKVGPTTEAAPVDTSAPKAYTAVHRGGGHWAVEDADGNVVGDFRGTKEEAQAEAERLTAGDPDLTDQGGSDLPDA